MFLEMHFTFSSINLSSLEEPVPLLEKPILTQGYGQLLAALSSNKQSRLKGTVNSTTMLYEKLC